MLEQRIEQHFIDSADLKYQAAQVLSKPIAAAVAAILASVTSGGKVLACGNGGSAADAQHFAAEFVGRFERERPELGAIALTTLCAGDIALQPLLLLRALATIFTRWTWLTRFARLP